MFFTTIAAYNNKNVNAKYDDIPWECCTGSNGEALRCIVKVINTSTALVRTPGINIVNLKRK